MISERRPWPEVPEPERHIDPVKLGNLILLANELAERDVYPRLQEEASYGVEPPPPYQRGRCAEGSFFLYKALLEEGIVTESRAGTGPPCYRHWMLGFGGIILDSTWQQSLHYSQRRSDLVKVMVSPIDELDEFFRQSGVQPLPGWGEVWAGATPSVWDTRPEDFEIFWPKPEH